MTAKEISAMKFITNIAGIVLIFSLTPAIAAEPCETLCSLTFYQTASAASVLNLLADGADVNAKDAQGKSPLHYVAGASLEVIAALLSAGADVMAKDTLDRTPLHFVSATGSPENIMILLNAVGKVRKRA
jgi:uncharacterized protein